MSESVNALIAQGGAQQNQNPLGMVGNVLDIARGAQALKAQQFSLQQAQLAPAYQSMRMLMATNPNPSWDDVNAALAQSKRIGGNVDGLVANAAEIAANGGKPADFMRGAALGGMSPEAQGTLAGPQMQARQTNQGTYYGTTGGARSPNANVFSPTGFVAGGLSPGQATEFITVPDVDANGRPTGTVHMVPRGTLFGGGTGVGGGDGGGGGGAPASGGGGAVPAVPAGPPPGSPVAPGTPLSQKDAALATYAQRESGNQNIFSKVQVPGYTQEQTGSGYYQIIPSTWAEGQQLAGIPPAQQTKLAIQASPQQQYQVASALYDKYGGKPWAQSAPQGQGGGGGPPASGAFIGATATQSAGGGGMQYFPASPGGGGGGASGGGSGIPGVQRGPGGVPILTPPAPWMGPIWEQSAKEYSTDVSREAGLAQRIQPWQSALSILKANPNLSTGPTSQQWNNWATTLSGYGVQLPSMPGGSVAAYQELSKALHQGLVNSGAFSGTDMARIEAEASSPNMQQQAEAIRELSARQIGYERFQMARLKYFRSLHPGEDPDQSANQYRSQTSTWASNLDPVAFAADNLSPQEISDYRKGLTPQQDEKFLRSIKAAHQLYPEITPGGQ